MVNLGNSFAYDTIALLFSIIIFPITISLKNAGFYERYKFAKKWSFLIQIFSGFFLGLIYFLIMLLVDNSPNNQINGIAITLILLPGTLFTTPYFAVGAILPMFIGILLLFNFSNTFIILYITISYLIYLAIIFVCTKFFAKWKLILKVIISHIFFTFVQSLLIIILNYAFHARPANIQKEFWIVSAILQIFILLGWICINYINKIYQKTHTLSLEVTYNYEYFVISNYTVESINDFIKNNNVQFAYLIGFSIKNISGGTYTLGSRIISEYKQTIANDIYKYFDKYPHKLFFINENEYFYVLIKTDYQITQSLDTAYHGNFLKFRQNQDFLKQFELFKISDYRFHNVEVTADINLIISLYGVHDNDIFKLINSTQVIVDSFEPNSKYNIIQLSDFRSKLALDQDMSEFQQLKQILDINEIKLKFKIFNFVNENINFPIFNDLKLMAFSTDAIIRLLPKKLHKIAIKHLASKAIEQFSKNIRSNESLMINYPIESLNNPDFSSQTFYSKIAYFNINAKQIIVLLDLDHLKENHDHAINNILNLKKIGIRVVCNNITAKTIDFVNAVKPYFVFLRALNTKDPKIKELQKLMKKILTKIKVKYYMTN